MRAVVLLLTALLLAGCKVGSVGGAGDAGDAGQGGNPDPAQVDAVEAPEVGACRNLTPEDVQEPSNATETVDCSGPHTARTYAVGGLPEELSEVGYESAELSRFAYRTCTDGFIDYLGATESAAMRTVLSWAWFRPSREAWDQGARWYRCDLVGGGEESPGYVALPERAKGLLLGEPKDRWMVCAVGDSVDGSEKVPCSQPHDWRAISTVQVGRADEKYPGDRVVEVQTREFCSDQVGAYLGYPVNYDFGYTWFHRAEWEAGNRRSVCWARTDG